MKKIYNGGCSAPKINGLSPVNCGAHFSDGINVYEAMSVEYSTHPTEIISKYVWVDGRKIEFSVWYNEGEIKPSFGMAWYKTKHSTHAYRYTQKIAKKWKPYLDEILKAYHQVFKD